jgi:WD40 repeat protein
LHSGTSTVFLGWNAEGNRLVSVHADGRLRWWKADGIIEETSPAVSAPVLASSWRPNGSHIAGCGGGRVFMWAADRTPTSSFDITAAKRNAAFVDWNQAGDQLVAGSDEPKLRLYSATGEAGVELTGHTKPIQGVSWSKGGAGLIATSSQDGTVRLWKPDGGEGPVINVVSPGSLAWSPTGDLLAVACTQGAKESRLTLWNADGTPGPDVVLSSDVRRLAWSPDGQKLAGAERSGAVKIWTRAGVHEKTLTAVPSDAKNLNLPVTWSKDGRIVAAGEDRTLRCWDEATGNLLWVAAAFSGGDFAVVGADGKSVGSLLAAEKSLVYLVERGGGRLEVLTPKAFEQL